MHVDQPELRDVATALNADAGAFTLIEVADGIAVASPLYDGVAAYQVLSGVMQIRLACGAHHIARANSIVLLPGATPVVISTGGGPGTVTIDAQDMLVRKGDWLVVDATGGAPARLVVAAARIAGTSGVRLPTPTIVSIARDTLGRDAVAMLHRELRQPGAASGSLVIALMTTCIVVGVRLALRRSDQIVIEPTVTHPLIGRAVAAVRGDPAGAHTLESMAEASGMSRSTFVRHFNRLFRISPMQFLLRLRLNEAAALLRSGELPIKAVAARTGFASRSHFSRAFTRMFGRDPSSFRDNEAMPAPQVRENPAKSEGQPVDI